MLVPVTAISSKHGCLSIIEQLLEATDLRVEEVVEVLGATVKAVSVGIVVIGINWRHCCYD